MVNPEDWVVLGLIVAIMFWLLVAPIFQALW